MSITLKIKNGTFVEGESLCRTCRSAHIQKGFRESEETIFCTFARFRAVPFKVAECTDYENRNVPYRWELEKMALLINVDPARKRAGFKVGTDAVAHDDVEDDDD
jgi:uncharacterized cysteine cluster protein YcgN (CxxCxxCC family)